MRCRDQQRTLDKKWETHSLELVATAPRILSLRSRCSPPFLLVHPVCVLCVPQPLLPPPASAAAAAAAPADIDVVAAIVAMVMVVSVRAPSPVVTVVVVAGDVGGVEARNV